MQKRCRQQGACGKAEQMLCKAGHQSPRQQSRQQNTAYAGEQGSRHDGPKRERHVLDYAPRPAAHPCVYLLDLKHFYVVI